MSFVFKSTENLIEQFVKANCFLGIELNAAAYLCRHFKGCIAQSPAGIGQLNIKHSFVLVRSITAQESLRLKALENWSKRAGIEIELFPKLFDIQLLMLPKHHHSNILSIGKVKFVKVRTILLDYFLGTGIQRKTQLVFQLKGIIFLQLCHLILYNVSTL